MYWSAKVVQWHNMPNSVPTVKCECQFCAADAHSCRHTWILLRFIREQRVCDNSFASLQLVVADVCSSNWQQLPLADTHSECLYRQGHCLHACKVTMEVMVISLLVSFDGTTHVKSLIFSFCHDPVACLKSSYALLHCCSCLHASCNVTRHSFQHQALNAFW